MNDHKKSSTYVGCDMRATTIRVNQYLLWFVLLLNLCLRKDAVGSDGNALT